MVGRGSSLHPTISEEARRLNAELHEQDDDWGRTNTCVANLALHVFQRFQCHDMLDYGCGKGEMMGMGPGPSRTHLYDPAVPRYSGKPKPADMVLCSAVLEHVEFYSLSPVMDAIKELAKRVVLFTITTVPASKTLSDGRNAHVTCHPIEWWLPGLVGRWTPQAMENCGPWFWYIGTTK